MPRVSGRPAAQTARPHTWSPWATVSWEWDPGQSADCTVRGPVCWVPRKNFLSPYARWTVTAPVESSAASAAVRSRYTIGELFGAHARLSCAMEMVKGHFSPAGNFYVFL